MQVQQKVRRLVFTEDDGELAVTYANRGEPFRDGVEFSFDRQDGRTCPIWVMLNASEVRMLRDKLNEFLGDAK